MVKIKNPSFEKDFLKLKSRPLSFPELGLDLAPSLRSHLKGLLPDLRTSFLPGLLIIQYLIILYYIMRKK